MPHVVGYTVVTSPEMHQYPEMRQRIEEDCAAIFETRHGCAPTDTTWHYEEAWTWTDPDTGQETEVHARWLCTSEGTEA